jgi:hypothetical protein
LSAAHARRSRRSPREGHGGDGEAADSRDVAHAQLGHGVEALAAQPSGGAGRDEQRRVAAEEPERRDVEVIAVQV